MSDIKEKEKIYAIDLDGCIFGFIEPYLKFLEATYKIKYPREKHIYWNVPSDGILSHEQAEEGLNLFTKAGLFANLDLIPYARTTVSRITNHGHKLYYITARYFDVRLDTEACLRRKRVSCAEQTLYISKPHTKVDGIKHCEATVFVDDKPAICNLVKFKLPDVKVYIFDAPYNRIEEVNKEVIRINGWKHFLDLEGL